MTIEEMTGKIICGDCLEIMKRMPDNCVDLVLTDIPYNEVNRNSKGLRNLDKGGADFMLHDVCDITKEIARITKGTVYMFCGIEQVSYVRKTLVASGLSTRHCVWWKTNPSPMNGQYLWLSAIENCIYGKHKKALFHRCCEHPVWQYPCGRSKIHPTQKPIGLFEYLLESSSDEDFLVFDPFLGSGTTAVACEKMGRRWIGIEISEEYCEIARKRVQEAKDSMGLFKDLT